MSKKLVIAFNALLRSPTAPSGLVPNEWHFDVRFVHFEPTPCHILFILQPESAFAHVERLPLGLSPRKDGLEYFPNTSEEAAPEIVKALIHIFVHNTPYSKDPSPPPARAPWRLTTQFKLLAEATSAEFRRLGVTPPALCTVGVSSRTTIRLAKEQFQDVFKLMLTLMRIPNGIEEIILTPDAIKFYESPHPGPPIFGEEPDATDEEKHFNRILQYSTSISKGAPPDGSPYMGPIARQRRYDHILEIEQLLKDKSEEHIKAEADFGASEAALDYGLRLSVGLGCKRNLNLSRQYLLKATTSKTASDKTKAIAHGLLIFWYMDATGASARTRYLYAACHHANAAAALCKRVSPPDEASSPAVLWFMSREIVPREGTLPPDIYYFYKDMFRAMDERNSQMNEGTSKMADKRLENPNRYCCAAVGCPIEADTGRMLARCSGPCDVDKKPSYCSKECQKADWRIHKPFCHAGAPCSVIKYQTADDIIHRTPSDKSSEGALTIPITKPDGTTMLFSSSTMGAADLKALVEASKEYGGNGIEDRMSAIRL